MLSNHLDPLRLLFASIALTAAACGGGATSSNTGGASSTSSSIPTNTGGASSTSSSITGGTGGASSTSSTSSTGTISTSSSSSSGAGGTTMGCGGPAPAGAYSLDFATAQIEDPLSAGGVWSNNTQGVGGNIAPQNFTSMRVALASDGSTRIAQDNHGGIDYDDSFAFVPGYDGDQFIEAVLYKEPGYNPNAAGSNHEIELLLGASTASGTRIWNEFLINSGGGVDIAYLDGGPSDFFIIANVNASGAKVPEDGDVIRAERKGNVLSFYINGVLAAGYDGSNPARVAKGSGIGLGGFVRAGATHNKYGVRCVTLGKL